MKMQPKKLTSIEELLETLPQTELDILEILREIILSCDDTFIARLSYNIPFYKKKRGVCFIWPGSIQWGKSTFEGVKIGLNYGAEFLQEDGFWQFNNRKCVVDKIYKSASEIDHELLKSYIYDALIYDQDR